MKSDWKGFFRDIWNVLTFRTRAGKFAVLIWLLALLAILRMLAR